MRLGDWGRERTPSRLALLSICSALAIASGLELVGMAVHAPASIRSFRAGVAAAAPTATAGANRDAGTDVEIDASPAWANQVSPMLAGDFPRRAHQAESPLAGKGMWIWQMDQIAGGNPARIAREAERAHISHIFVRAGSGHSGLNTLGDVRRLIPYAHARGIKVIAWYFPYFNNIKADVARSIAILKTFEGGETFDALALDIEPAAGSALSERTVTAYSSALRAAAPQAYLVLVPPRPTKHTIAAFPFDAAAPHYSAIAPMVYWGRYDPADTVAAAIEWLSRYGKPVAPIGQAYDMGPEGGPRGNPPPYQTWAFMEAAKNLGAPGVSFWSWQEASSPEFDAIRHFLW